ncbi:cupin domain-containing protein [Klebsiella aerogenes]|uniref:cupin domain-containing protein n=1 Tax=Klebsiella aerogenes TaxID=548 RepID=UPI0013A6704D|nr:cupin domain-containing protein [Klebsiella aerogenes]HCB2860446.1 cupin domain-containing protein [Klebsiella aerogenes]HCB2864783.1 cupin domain-containing protein [Klebsiella aerogenes]HCB2881609.1 cupin domain-containing protein [Klebsiella aerogenes]HCB3345846.1 cupin domain-containing protein [Klebsiella aerogenes]HCM1812514.1 cupin domain-containing protein [Klebsiella aerogenes]
MSNEQNILHFGDVDSRILITSDDLILAELHIPAGVVASVHQHLHEEVIFVVSGVMDFMCDGQVTTLRAGQAIRIPPGQSHNITCHPDAQGVVVTAWTPSRQDLITHLKEVLRYEVQYELVR